MNNKSDDNRGGLGKSLLERVKDIYQKAGKTFAGFVGPGGELEKEARRKAEIRINEIIKRLSSRNLSTTEIQELIREGNELLQNFPGLSIATAFSSAAAQAGGTSVGISQSQPTVTNNNREIKDEKIISLSELFNFHPDIIKAEEENKKLKNRFDAIKREPPNEESVSAMRSTIDEHKNPNKFHSFIDLTGKALHAMGQQIDHLKERIHIHGEDHHIPTLETMIEKRDNFRKESQETAVDIVKATVIAQEVGKSENQMSNQQVLEACKNFNNLELTRDHKTHIYDCLDQAEKGLDFKPGFENLMARLNIKPNPELSPPQPNEPKDKDPNKSKWTDLVSQNPKGGGRSPI